MKNRRITVGEQVKPQRTGSRRTVFPSIRLQGKWMQDAGILPGTVVNIEVKPNQLIITL